MFPVVYQCLFMGVEQDHKLLKTFGKLVPVLNDPRTANIIKTQAHLEQD